MSAAPTATPGITPARRCAFAVIRRVFEEGAYADRALHSHARGLDPRDRALATRIAYGTVQRRATLDHLIARSAERDPAELDPAIRAALRMGLYELHFLGGVAPHATVNEAVELARGAGATRAAGLVNAVLRRSAREGQAALEALTDDTPAGAAVKHSVPLWVAERWFAELGAGEARALLSVVNEPAENAIRANTLVPGNDAATLAARLPVATERDALFPDALIVVEPFDAHGAPAHEDGLFMPQSRASQLAARVLAPEPGDRVLDLCAAPGAKTTHLAALAAGTGQVIAVERNARRAQSLRETCARMRAGNVEVCVADAREAQLAPGSFDRVLADPPCSGLGTLQSRPDLRWRAGSGAIDELARIQSEILDAAANATAPGGRLVYSTCTVSRAENEDQITAFLARNRAFALEERRSDLPAWHHPQLAGTLMALPHRHQTDGFFIAGLRREA